MKFTKMIRYALRSIIDLAIYYKDSPITIKEISQRQNVSCRYLENIFHELKKNNILDSLKGKGGGFFFKKKLSEISLLDLMEILEGRLCVVECVENSDICDRYLDCKTKNIWINLNKKLKSTFKEITLDKIIESECNTVT